MVVVVFGVAAVAVALLGVVALLWLAGWHAVMNNSAARRRDARPVVRAVLVTLGVLAAAVVNLIVRQVGPP